MPDPGIALPDGSTSNFVKDRTCPYREVSTMIEGAGGKPATLVAAQPCMKNCGVYDRDAGECGHVVIGRALGSLLKLAQGFLPHA